MKSVSGKVKSLTNMSGRRTSHRASMALEKSGLWSALRKVSMCRKISMSSGRRSSKWSSSMLDGVVNKASAVFVCCARSDALNHARVLRSELSIRLNRGCAVGGGPNTVQWIEQSEAVVVVLTTALVTDPDALFEIWTALSHDIPIITVAVAGEYNFAPCHAEPDAYPTKLGT
jgi:hypothetical protein